MLDWISKTDWKKLNWGGRGDLHAEKEISIVKTGQFL